MFEFVVEVSGEVLFHLGDGESAGPADEVENGRGLLLPDLQHQGAVWFEEGIDLFHDPPDDDQAQLEVFKYSEMFYNPVRQ